MNEIRGYLYSIKEDFTLIVQEGYFRRHGCNNWSKRGLFYSDDGKWGFVASTPGELYYKKLWLKERDDNLARQCYLNHHAHRVEELERQLDMHRRAGVALLKEINDGHISI